MNFLKNSIKIGVLLFFGAIYAQQQPNYALYRYTMNAINPAYAGADGVSRLTANFRSQWINIEDAPETQTLFFETSLNDKVGLGLSIVNDDVFANENTSFVIDFSYKLQLNETTDVFLGLKGGGSVYNFISSDLSINGFPPDPAQGNIDNGFRPIIGAGAYLVHDKYFISLSIPSILLNERVNLNSDGVVTTVNEKTHFYLSGGYNFDISSDWEFRPSTMVRAVSGSPLSADLTAAFRYNERFELAPMYRTDGGWAGTMMFNLSDWMDLGYAYEGSSRQVLNDSNDGTHEVMVRFTF
ncbi:type IX secretion system PorP/SprF family membrane protein [Winogradskyella wandonensis]|uniref:Type IX secretion system PorP/SprF family membrane protein n=1 Tax=Winogradskyella wandonensis TaxID=1442586 RepID=A0A4V2PTY9_9FLAO|nr:type IX secretion system membrane protein PorP/SprF [Winogradskyella wandonensis]TCK68061.1 type IX secretion system PorP/SprF family membrane protein [Winogradskyella wandonensis]